MGIHCDINLRKPTNGNFVTGGTVSGAARYALDEETVYTKISISINGRGYLEVLNGRKKGEADGLIKDEEKYLKEEIIILDDNNGQGLPIDTYDTQFNFQLPLDIPPTTDFVKTSGSYTVRCKIIYYIEFKFECPDGCQLFSSTISVIPGVNPKISAEPRIYDKQRKLIQLLRDSFVTLKATINNPVVTSCNKADLEYEIFNDTNVNFKCVESKLVEVTSLPKGYINSTFDYELVADINTTGLRSGETQTIDVDIPIPRDVHSIEYSQLIARDYFVKITVYLPLPYRNVTLKVPLQIAGASKEHIMNEDEELITHWKAMNEDGIQLDIHDS
ncbi:uncharacterized protein LOC125230589 [Leguminivora glycinivorella]|uniref:uncharacterized protein LOC125230589 n=1 Tax=Leguminivora glycinivorella TaxID=1035111 RepID=UPI00200C9C36|nr:uncharacterized protein LOC125230589 [Leguminivora glycinivorella]